MYEKRKGTSKVTWIIIGIIVLIAFYLPFYGHNLRSNIGYEINSTLESIGSVLYFVGIFMIVIGVIRIFTGSSGGGIKMAILGYLILMISFWLYNPADFSIFSGPLPDTLGGEPRGKGYH